MTSPQEEKDKVKKQIEGELEMIVDKMQIMGYKTPEICEYVHAVITTYALNRRYEYGKN